MFAKISRPTGKKNLRVREGPGDFRYISESLVVDFTDCETVADNGHTPNNTPTQCLPNSFELFER
jgi:hypothetical protein